MRKALTLALCLLAPVFMFAQHRYGFGLVVVEKYLPNNRVISKTVFVSKVVDLDSLERQQCKSVKRKLPRNERYLACVGDWFVEVIRKTYPDSLPANTDIFNVSHVELAPDLPMTGRKRLDEISKKMNRKNKPSYMDRNLAVQRKNKFLKDEHREAVIVVN